MKGQQLEDKRDALLQVRACLGRWQSGNTYITIRERGVTPQFDLKQFSVEESRGAYKKPLNYNITARELDAKVKTLQQGGYKLTVPEYPELKEFFRNGKPITQADIFEDAFDSMVETDTKQDDRTGLEFLMDNWK